jgi:hypothetical protein
MGSTFVILNWSMRLYSVGSDGSRPPETTMLQPTASEIILDVDLSAAPSFTLDRRPFCGRPPFERIALMRFGRVKRVGLLSTAQRYRNSCVRSLSLTIASAAGLSMTHSRGSDATQ